MRRSAPAVIAGIALLAVGCSNDQLASPEPTEAPAESTDGDTPEPTEPSDNSAEPEADPDLPSDEDIESFIQALATSTVSDLEAARELVAEDSAAADYLVYYRHLEEAAIDGGFSNDAADQINDIEDGFEVCATFEGEENCTTFTEFVGDDGQITDFRVQDRDLSDRLAMGSGEEVSGPGGSSFKLVAAYRNAADTHLFVNFEMRSGKQALDLPIASYRGAEGRQSSAESYTGSSSLAPDSMSHYVVVFPGAEPGGELLLEVYGETFGSEVVTLSTD